MDHLLTLPLSSTPIAAAKILANGLIILAATALSLYFIVRGPLAVPIAGSIPLFLGGVAIYLFFALSVGLFLATLVKSMPQFGLLFMLVYLPMQMLSGGNTPQPTSRSTSVFTGSTCPIHVALIVWSSRGRPD